MLQRVPSTYSLLARRLVRAAAVLLAVSIPVPALGQGSGDLAEWRRSREASLQTDDGWLSVAGLFWLEEGDNRFGTGAGNALALPSGSAPADAGVFTLQGGKVTFRMEPKVEATLNSRPAQTGELRSDQGGKPDTLRVGRLSMTVILRGGRVGIRLRDPESANRKAFKGLEWYPFDPSYRVTARFIPYTPPRTIRIANVLGQYDDMPCPGQAIFTLGGQELTLEPVAEPGAKELFFIFRDATAGQDTYPGGRYLYTALPSGGTIVLDFNRAVSPPCAFTEFATCPLPPRQNRLSVKVEAGERRPRIAH